MTASRTTTSGTQGTVAERLATVTVYLYIDLWVLEGAFRKWVPALDQIGYIARDAVLAVVIVIVLFLPRGRTRRPGVFWLFAIAIFIFGALQVAVQTIPFAVMLVGLRSYIAPALLPALVWQFRHTVDFCRVARRVLFYLPIQGLVIVLQVISPPNAMINWSVSDDVSGFTNFGVARASGTFSATSGLSSYLIVATALALAALVIPRIVSTRYAFIAVLISLGAAALSGSRTTLAWTAFTFVIFLLIIALRPRQAGATSHATVLLCLSLAFALSLCVAFLVFPHVTDSFGQRIVNANQSEDPVERLLRQTFQFAGYGVDYGVPGGYRLTLFGDGLGANSQAGIAAGSAGPWIEIESTRWVFEAGAIGFLFALIKLAGAFVITTFVVVRWKSLEASFILLASVLVPILVLGQISQTPSLQGAFGICVSLMMLSREYFASTEITSKRNSRLPVRGRTVH